MYTSIALSGLRALHRLIPHRTPPADFASGDEQQEEHDYRTDLWNNGNRERLDSVLGDSEVMYLDNRSDLVGPEAYWEFVSTYREAFPDLRLTIQDIVSEGDKIVLRNRLQGTHEGSLFGVAATGNHVDVTRVVIHHIDDGRINETGMVEDTIGLFQQLGVHSDTVEM